HSNLHMIEGDFRDFGIPAKLPIIPGHEITGVVEEVGKGVRGFGVGDRVGVQVLYESCRSCDYCLSGNENLCLERKGTGESVDGGYAEYIVAPYDFIYRLPDNLGFEEAAPLFCPGVTAYRAVRKAGVTFGQKVAVIGIGGVGHMSLQFAKLAGAEVTAIDVNEETLRMAEELGADNVLLASQVEEHVLRSGKFDVVMVHAPSQKAVEQAQKIVKRAGTILMAVKGNMNISFPEEHKIISSVIGSRQDMRETLKIASTRKIKVKYTTYKLSEAEQVLIRLKQGKIVGRAVLTP
ncbi:MAG: alcohol dehydrogenase catalytic domain-containing protein, partial [Nitrososphaeria archaeon]|nr:alcohol dehydrogenase catalytic domain-containing protein [Nitrososphaeria archaeon]